MSAVDSSRVRPSETCAGPEGEVVVCGPNPDGTRRARSPTVLNPRSLCIVSPAVSKCTVVPTVCLLLLLAACSGQSDSAQSHLPAKLTVLVQEDHSFYYRNETDEWEGFNHELIDRMQRHLAVPVEIKSFASSEALFQAFEAGQGDIMCPALALKRASPDPTVLTEIARQGFPDAPLQSL